MQDSFPKPMGCDDVIRALSAPQPGDQDASSLADHLADCPNCAARWERDAALTRRWELTRPVEPSDRAWDALWARVSERLDQAPDVIPMPARGLPLRRASVSLAGIVRVVGAVAAVGLLMLVPAPISPSRVDAKATNVEISEGPTVLIHQNSAGQRTVVQVDLVDKPNALDGNFAMFNAFEAMVQTE